MAGIAKKAQGLQRYMLDCGFWQSPSWRGLRRVAEIGLMAAAVSYCNEHLTDGELPAPADELASALGLQQRDIAKPLTKFLEAGKWVEKDGNYVIVGYLDHNPSRIEVGDDRRRRTTAAAKANHERWHVEKGITDPDCPLCPTPPSSGVRSDSDTGSDHVMDVGDIPTEGTEVSEPKELKDVGPSSSVTVEPAGAVRADDDDGIPPRWAFLEAERLAKLPRRPGVVPIADHESWVLKTARKVWEAYWILVTDWAELEPALTADEIAARIAARAEPADPDRRESLAERDVRLGLVKAASA